MYGLIGNLQLQLSLQVILEDSSKSNDSEKEPYMYLH